MKKLLWMGTLALALSMAGSGTAQAGDEGWAALGGFIGGAILSDAFGHHGHHSVETRVIVNEPYYVREVVHHAPRYVSRRVWHEGYWSYAHDRCGRRIKTWNPGYYTVEQVRVSSPRHEVSYRSHHRSYRDDHYRSRRSCRW